MLSNEELKTYKKNLPFLAKNPIIWARDYLGFNADPWQKKVLTDLVNHNKVAVASGNGPGKTALASIAGYHFLTTRYNAIVVCTAPSKSQLYNALWREAKRWYDTSSLLQTFLDFTATKISVKGSSKTWYMIAQTAQVKAGSETSEGLQGIHGANVLCIVDEASGVPEPVMSAIENATTQEGNKILLIGNPIRNMGFFYDSFTRFQHRWETHHVNTEKVKRVSRDFIKQMREKYGKDSQMYGVKVLGEFPKHSAEVWVSEYDFLRAVGNTEIDTRDSNISVGWDFAREGPDSTARAVFQGYSLIDLRMYKNLTVDRCIEQVANTKKEFPGCIQKVDAIGLGAGVADHFRLDRSIEGIIANHKASDPDTFASITAEAAYIIRRSFEQSRIFINPNLKNLSLLKEDLTDRMLVVNDTTGKVVLEPKNDFKKRHGQRSPDAGDAFILGFMGVDPFLQKRPPPGSRAPKNLDLSGRKSKFNYAIIGNKSKRYKGASKWVV